MVIAQKRKEILDDSISRLSSHAILPLAELTQNTNPGDDRAQSLFVEDLPWPGSFII
jgi:hypothetical protein